MQTNIWDEIESRRQWNGEKKKLQFRVRVFVTWDPPPSLSFSLLTLSLSPSLAHTHLTSQWRVYRLGLLYTYMSAVLLKSTHIHLWILIRDLAKFYLSTCKYWIAWNMSIKFSIILAVSWVLLKNNNEISVYSCCSFKGGTWLYLS